jgi:hypothetical protein
MTTPDGSPIPGLPQVQAPPQPQSQPQVPQAAQQLPPGVVIPAQPSPAPGVAPPQFVVVPGRPVTPQERGSGGGIPIIREYSVPDGASRP